MTVKQSVKMTNKEEEGESPSEPRFAALLAVHLVSQVLDEAYVIVNAATESGQPCRYLSMLKELRCGKFVNGADQELLFYPSHGDSSLAADVTLTENNVDNLVATSTPQKLLVANMPDTTFIGQGDEELSSVNMRHPEFDTSTSMLINHLFDMSEVEHVIICEDNEATEIKTELEESSSGAMNKIMESLVNTAFTIGFEQNIENVNNSTGEKSPSTENSAYSYLTDAFTVELTSILGDVTFSLNNENTNDTCQVGSSVIITEVNKVNDDENEELNRTDAARYENAYLTLNRDFDQCSEDDAEPILVDPVGMMMQEVDLITGQVSDDNESEEPEQKKDDLKAISAVSGSSHKSMVQRCKTQGARLLACLRGWWRRKTPGKRKEARVPGSVRGLCPLSPDARRRAASLLDHRRLSSSPTSSHQTVWKFNTVSEALVNSSRWKNYAYDENPDECPEC